jgi:hypothetical protein
MGSRSTVRALVATVVLGAGTATAFAQDYTVSQVSGQYVTPPATATDFGLVGDDVTKTMNPTPFPINYYGSIYNQLTVSTNGFVQFGSSNTSGCCSPIAGPLSGASDGICAVSWADLYVVTSTLTGRIYTWTSGTAPNRILYVCWTNLSLC